MAENGIIKTDRLEIAAACLGVFSLGVAVFVWMSYSSTAWTLVAVVCGVLSIVAHLSAKTRNGWGRVGAFFGMLGILLSTLSYLFVHVFPRQV